MRISGSPPRALGLAHCSAPASRWSGHRTVLEVPPHVCLAPTCRLLRPAVRRRPISTPSSSSTTAASSRSYRDAPLRDRDDLSLAYTPGVAEVSLAIAADPTLADVYTARANTVAVVTDGTAVLGPGRHRPGRRAAGDGGQGGAVQALRRRRRRAGLPGDPGRRGAGRDGRPDGADVRRDQPRGHLGAALLRGRATGCRSGSTSRSSTTTSTARRSWCWPACSTPRRWSAGRCRTCGSWSAVPGRPGSR